MQTVIGDMIRSLNRKTANGIWLGAMTNELMRQMKSLNLDTQLDEQGVYSDGTDTPEYSPFTQEIKERQGKIYEHMNFDDTGATRRSIEYEGNILGVEIGIDDYHDVLIDYSENIIGLTEQSKESLHEDIIKNIQKEITDY